MPDISKSTSSVLYPKLVNSYKTAQSLCSQIQTRTTSGSPSRIKSKGVRGEGGAIEMRRSEWYIGSLCKIESVI